VRSRCASPPYSIDAHAAPNLGQIEKINDMFDAVGLGKVNKPKGMRLDRFLRLTQRRQRLLSKLAGIGHGAVTSGIRSLCTRQWWRWDGEACSTNCEIAEIA
jgi:hypothetical protein